MQDRQKSPSSSDGPRIKQWISVSHVGEMGAFLRSNCLGVAGAGGVQRAERAQPEVP